MQVVGNSISTAPSDRKRKRLPLDAIAYDSTNFRAAGWKARNKSCPGAAIGRQCAAPVDLPGYPSWREVAAEMCFARGASDTRRSGASAAMSGAMRARPLLQARPWLNSFGKPRLIDAQGVSQRDQVAICSDVRIRSPRRNPFPPGSRQWAARQWKTTAPRPRFQPPRCGTGQRGVAASGTSVMGEPTQAITPPRTRKAVSQGCFRPMS